MIRVSGAMQFLKATETKIELQENQRSDRIIDTLINEVIFPPALSDSWVARRRARRRIGARSNQRSCGITVIR